MTAKHNRLWTLRLFCLFYWLIKLDDGYAYDGLNVSCKLNDNTIKYSTDTNIVVINEIDLYLIN